MKPNVAAISKREIMQITAPILTEDEKRRVALAMQEEILRKVTWGPADCSGSVTGAPERIPTAAKGVGAGAEALPHGQKSRVLPRRPAPLKLRPRRRRRQSRTGGRTSSC